MRTSPTFAPIRLSLILLVALAVLLPIDLPPRVSASPAPANLNSLPSGRHTLRVEPLLSVVLERLQALSFGAVWLPKPVAPLVPSAPVLVYTVNSLGDAGTGSGTTGDLRYCLTQANAAGGANTINFGVTGTITLGSELTISSSVTVQGPGVSQLTISGNNAVRVFNIGSGSFDVTFADLTIANGRAPVSFFSAQGGGILNNSTGTLNITNCTLSGNTAAVSGANTGNLASGGGIFNASTGNVNLINSTLSGNAASATNAVTNNTSRGGGIYNAGAGAVTLTNSMLSNNSVFASGSATVNTSLGGGIYNYDTGAVNVLNSTLSNNTVTAGGAVTGNQSNGGGIFNFGSGTVTVTGSTLSNNAATANGSGNNGNSSYGGGIYNGNTGIVKVTSSTLSNNSASASGNNVTNNSGLGGGIFCGTGTVYVTNSTLASNTVSASGSPATINYVQGGGIYNPGATLSVTNSTLSSNAGSASGSNPSSQGGGIFRGSGTTNVKNSIVAGNTANTAPDVFGTFTSQGYNLIGNNTGSSGFTNGVNNDQVGSAGFPLDPLLGPLQNNGGPTQTMALLNASPAIDKGAAATDPATGNLLTTDQLGTLRPADQPGVAPALGGDNSDIGAFEIPPSNCSPNLTVNHPGDEMDAAPGNGVCATSGGVCTLRAAIQEANALTLCAPQTINFSVTGTITLSSPLPTITHDLTINGPGPKASNLVIEGNNTFLLMKAAGAGVDLTINLLSFTKGGPNDSTAGALEFINSNVLSVTDSEFYGNQGISVNGEFVINAANSTGVTLNRCTVRNNATSGIRNDLAPLTVTSSTFSDNNGTAIYNVSTGTSVSYSTITNHLVGIWNDASVQAVSATIKNNLLSGNGNLNLRKTGAFSNTLTSQGYNLIDDDKGNLIDSAGPGDLLNVASAQPTLAAVGDYGGATQTRALLPGSQALNAGTNTGAPATDQRGIARPQQGTTDIGAFESQGFTLAISGGNNQSTTINTNFTLPLSVSVTANGAGEPVNGGQVTFTPPGSGASVTIAGTPATISSGNSDSATTGTLAANGTAGSYNVTASANGAAALNFTLTNGCDTPVISMPPQPQTVCAGAPATFSVTATGTNLMYQWRKGGNPISGATLSSYTIPTTVLSDVGSYDVVVIGACGTLTSDPAMLVVNAATTITTPPASQTKLTGESVTFNVAATGTNLGYQWRKNSNPIGSANSNSLTLNGLMLTDAGSYDVIVSGTCGMQTSAAATLLVNCPGLTVNPTTLPNAPMGASYNQTISATGGNAPYTFAVTGGALPAGLMLSPQGQLTGTLNVGGSFNFAISAMDTAGCVSSRAYTIATNAPPTLAPVPLNRAAGSNEATFPIATVSDAETAANQLQFMLSSDGTNFGSSATLNGVTVTLIGILPNGQVNALITTTCAASTAAFTLKVTDAAGVSGTAPWTVTVPINPAPVLSYSAQSVALGQSLLVNPVSGPNDNGTLASLVLHSITPALGGVSVNSNNGVVTISNAAAGGSYVAVIRAIDNCGRQTDANLSFNVTCPTLSISPATLPNGVQGTSYQQTLTVTPDGTMYSFAVTTGTLPPGLSLNSATGALTGTPTAPGNYTFGITATGWGSCSKSQSYNVLITGTCTPLTLTPPTLPAATLGTAYNQTITATGGVAPYSYSLSSGALPAGLSLSSGGALTGTPTAAGTFAFTLKATGQGGCFSTRAYVLTVTCATLTFNPATLPTGMTNQPYTQTLTITPAGTYTFSLLLGSLPPGFTLSSAGILSGITNQTGTYNFTVKVLGGTCQATKAYTLTISASAAALAQMADYDGDGQGDFVLWANDGTWRMLLSQSGLQRQAQAQTWGQANDVSLLGDYDGDRRTDLAVFRPTNGTWYVKQSRNDTVLIKAWGVAGDVLVPGDYDGDGKTDLAVFRPSEGNWYVLRSSDQHYAVTAWGAGYAPYNDVAVPGDYDGDGRTDLAVFRRSTGQWFIQHSKDGQTSVKLWGVGTDEPVPADYDGDGQIDIAVWRQGVWYIWQSATGEYRVEHWGTSAAPYYDQAVPSDYDGDGRAEIAVWRAGDLSWHVKHIDKRVALPQTQGQTGDIPVAAKR